MCLCNSVSHTCFSLGYLSHKHFQDYSLKVVLPEVFFSISSLLSGVGMIFGEVMSNEAKHKGCRNNTSFPVSPLPGAIVDDRSSARALALGHIKIPLFLLTWMSQNIKYRVENMRELILHLYSKEGQTCWHSSSNCLWLWQCILLKTKMCFKNIHVSLLSLCFLTLSFCLIPILFWAGLGKPLGGYRCLAEGCAGAGPCSRRQSCRSLCMDSALLASVGGIQGYRCAVQHKWWAPPGHQAKRLQMSLAGLGQSSARITVILTMALV